VEVIYAVYLSHRTLLTDWVVVTPIFQVKLEDVLDNKHLPPLSLRDFECVAYFLILWLLLTMRPGSTCSSLPGVLNTFTSSSG
jgi:hypothetical protein